MRFHNLVFLVAMLCAIAAPGQNDTPNLSGIWRLDPQKGKHSFPRPEEMRVKIDQHGDDITIALRVRQHGSEEIQTHHYRAGSDDNRNEMHGAPMKSSARWDGGALVIDSIAKLGGGALHLNDRWTLSADGQTLTFVERHQLGDEPAAEETDVFEKQVNATWEPPEPPKPAEEAFKNIQVMKGVPSSQLIPAMVFFTRSLGVKCDYCHVPKEFEKDDKPAKATARKMLKMVHEINAGNFGDKNVVSCWTCHRGSAEPQSAPQ